jgi:hypothetical protein
LDRVAGVSVASKNAARYVKPLLDPDDTEEQLVQKSGPQARVPLASKYSGHRPKDEFRWIRAEKDIAKVRCVESHNKSAKPLESFALATREGCEARSGEVISEERAMELGSGFNPGFHGN